MLSVAQHGAVESLDFDRDFPEAELPDQGFGPGGRTRFEAERGAAAPGAQPPPTTGVAPLP